MSRSSAGDLPPTLHPVYQADLYNDSVYPQTTIFPTVIQRKKKSQNLTCAKTLMPNQMPYYINASQNRPGVTWHPGPSNTRARNPFFADQEYLKGQRNNLNFLVWNKTSPENIGIWY